MKTAMLKMILTASMVVGAGVTAQSARAAEKPYTAEAIVRKSLMDRGIEIGIDTEKERYVFVGSCERDISDPLSEKNFLLIRAECAKIAELHAKSEIMQARQTTISASVSTGVQSCGNVTRKYTASIFKAVAADRQSGATVLTSAESWDGKRFQVAVAVGWSKKLEEAGMRLQSATLPTGDSVEDDEEWKKWADSVNLPMALGSRQFKDSQGRRRYVGIGVSDITGKSGVQLKEAMNLAKMAAKENLAFALYSESVSHRVAESIVQEIDAGDLSEEDAWETFTSRVMRTCKGKILRGHEVYCTEAIYPLTGSTIYISVYGIEPSQVPPSHKETPIK